MIIFDFLKTKELKDKEKITISPNDLLFYYDKCSFGVYLSYPRAFFRQEIKLNFYAVRDIIDLSLFCLWFQVQGMDTTLS